MARFAHSSRHVTTEGANQSRLSLSRPPTPNRDSALPPDPDPLGPPPHPLPAPDGPLCPILAAHTAYPPIPCGPSLAPGLTQPAPDGPLCADRRDRGRHRLRERGALHPSCPRDTPYRPPRELLPETHPPVHLALSPYQPAPETHPTVHLALSPYQPARHTSSHPPRSLALSTCPTHILPSTSLSRLI